ncbi:hypothetical protein GS489_01155 [Rhodococcus hoagii]|nr:hypothetical protein [Prescottella equi]
MKCKKCGNPISRIPFAGYSHSGDHFQSGMCGGSLIEPAAEADTTPRQAS